MKVRCWRMLWSPPYQVIIPAYSSRVLEWRLLCVERTSACNSQLSLQIVEWVFTLSFSHSPTEASTYCFLDTWIFVLFLSLLAEHTQHQILFPLQRPVFVVSCVRSSLFGVWLGLVFLAMRSEVKASCCPDASLIFVHTYYKVKFNKPYYGISTRAIQ